MIIRKLVRRALFLGLVLLAQAAPAQQRTMGVLVNDTAHTWKGYTLFAPKHYGDTYLIDNDGQMVHKWTGCAYEPGQSVYLLPNGHLLRACMTKGPLSTGGGEGGRIEEYDWDSKLVWGYDYSTATYMQHHDIRPLPNGNILLLAVEKKTPAELLAAGFNPGNYQPDVLQKGYLLPEYVVEVTPVPPTGGTVIWEWHVWDHLGQDHDATKANYGTVADHPELVDVDGDGKKLPSFWNHANAVNYHPRLDQIMISVRNNSEMWVIDHSTTTAEAKSHSGGRSEKGGDVLYRWGNPVCYKLGATKDQMLYQQHDAQWIDDGLPGEGDILVFNNGLGRNYSTVDQFTPPVDANGNYTRTAGAAFGPAGFVWSYKATPPESMYAGAISGAQRLPNGNTLIDDGTHGTFIEVTPGGEAVWKYINPVVRTGPLTQGDTIPDDPAREGEKMNGVFRVQRYSPSNAGLAGRDLTPKGTVELYLTAVDDESPSPGDGITLEPNYPNPFNPSTAVRFHLARGANVRLTVSNLLGQEVARLVDGFLPAGTHVRTWDAAQLPGGAYLIRLASGDALRVRRAVLSK
jgi:hypothetical protein